MLRGGRQLAGLGALFAHLGIVRLSLSLLTGGADSSVPLDLVFRDEAGNTVRLADYFHGKPVVLSLVYYRCPGLCTMTLNGMVKSFRPLKRRAMPRLSRSVSKS